MTLLAGLAIRSSLMLLAGLLLTTALSRRSAALRHRVLAASLLSAVAVAPLSLALPAWTVTVPAPDAGLRGELISANQVELRSAPTGTAPSPSVISEGSASLFSLELLIVFVWISGVIATGGVLAVGVLRVARLSARATRIRDVGWLATLEALKTRFGVQRPVVIARTDSRDLLATWGCVRPQILLPIEALEWAPHRIQVVLCHELAHIRRHDWLVQIASEAVRAILWFNPLAWMACSRLRRESEQACDDEVLGAGVEGRDYAALLLDLARQFRRRGPAWLSATPMARHSTLERRISAMLNPRLDRRIPSRRVMAAAAVALLLVTVPLATLRARQSGPTELSGTVYDPTGGVLPGVKVMLLGANEQSVDTTTDATGRFHFPAVAPGKWMLEAALPGFRSLRHELVLRDAEDWRRVITLQVGEVSETITVRGTRASGPNGVKSDGAPLRVGGNIKPPRKVRDVRPNYPASMREAGFTGVVPLEAVIGTDGTVSAVRVLSAHVHPDFAIATADAVRQWRFTPTLLNGNPVEVVMKVSVRFDLN